MELFSEELDLKESFALRTFAPVFQTEVHAIFAGSDDCLKKFMSVKMICICLDSRAASLSLNLHTVSLRVVLQCRSSLQRISTHNRVQLYWVTGHCRIIGNEEADGLAGLGSKSDFYESEPCLPVPKALLTHLTEKWLVASHSFY
jgi:hypothetical protein